MMVIDYVAKKKYKGSAGFWTDLIEQPNDRLKGEGKKPPPLISLNFGF